MRVCARYSTTETGIKMDFFGGPGNENRSTVRAVLWLVYSRTKIDLRRVPTYCVQRVFYLEVILRAPESGDGRIHFGKIHRPRDQKLCVERRREKKFANVRRRRDSAKPVSDDGI